MSKNKISIIKKLLFILKTIIYYVLSNLRVTNFKETLFNKIFSLESKKLRRGSVGVSPSL